MKKATFKEIKLIPIDGIPLVKPGDDLPGIIIRTANASKIEWIEGDILVIAPVSYTHLTLPTRLLV